VKPLSSYKQLKSAKAYCHKEKEAMPQNVYTAIFATRCGKKNFPQISSSEKLFTVNNSQHNDIS